MQGSGLPLATTSGILGSPVYVVAIRAWLTGLEGGAASALLPGGGSTG